MSQLLTGEAFASFLALTFLEIVLGLDNLVFLALAVNRLKSEDRGAGDDGSGSCWRWCCVS